MGIQFRTQVRICSTVIIYSAAAVDNLVLLAAIVTLIARSIRGNVLSKFSLIIMCHIGL